MALWLRKTMTSATRRLRAPTAFSLFLLAFACSTAGSTWMSEPATASDERAAEAPPPAPEARGGARPEPARFQTRVIGREPGDPTTELAESGAAPGSSSFAAGGNPGAPSPGPLPGGGKVLGTFRNTYYDFPAEAEFSGEPVSLKDQRCETISAVPRGFFEAVCVQGSGILGTGRAVSFAKRDCDCAEVCPKTGQKICFDSLDPAKYPWGRGARGQAITPLLTVAVDDAVVPLGTSLYVPEYDGVPVDAARSSVHDGCFIAEDRGLRVKGQHLDIFTGSSDTTKLWNQLVPSNRGVTVVVDSPRCARASVDDAARRSAETKPAPSGRGKPSRAGK